MYSAELNSASLNQGMMSLKYGWRRLPCSFDVNIEALKFEPNCSREWRGRGRTPMRSMHINFSSIWCPNAPYKSKKIVDALCTIDMEWS